MPRRIDTSGRTINRRELEDDENDVIIMTVPEWKRIQDQLKRTNQNPIASKPDLSVLIDNTEVGESPKKQAHDAVQGE